MTKTRRQVAVAAEYIAANIGGFHAARLRSLEKLSLEKVLLRKNPYLFKAKNILTAEAFVKYILDAHLSSQEETMFGDFLEGLAIHICQEAYRGRKSSAEGIDLEFVKGGVLYLVAIKSGPNWGNSSQIKKMKEHFRQAKRVLRTSDRRLTRMPTQAVNGCCYGKEPVPEKEEYAKLCGQEFWHFISGSPTLYQEIIEPLGQDAKAKNDRFNDAYAQLINRFTREFADKFCTENKIDWEKIVRFNSAK